MPSSYTTSLRLTLPATGELSGTWGSTVNTGITELLDAAVAGTATISTWGGAGVAYTLSNNSGTADEARKMFIVATGSPGEAKNVICPAVSKFYVFRNDTAGGYALTLKTSGGTGIAVPAGQYKFLYCDGTNVVEAFNSAGALTLSGALSVGGTTTLASNPTLSAGTANGVTYLNGSKVLTSGSALTFDGTNLGVGTSSPSTYGELAVYRAKTGTVAISVTQQNASTNDGAKLATFYQATETASLKYYWDGSQFQGQLYSYGPLAFTLGSSPSEQMRLTSTGLGIGTSSPGSKLEVTTSATNTNVASFYNTDTADGNGVYIKAGGVNAGKYALYIENGSGTAILNLLASGNLGLGVTPSAWVAATALQLKKSTASAIEGAIYQGAIGINNANGISYNAYYNGTTWQYIYGTSHPASRYEQSQGAHAWHIAGSGTGTASFTQAMTLDTGGNLLVGTTSAVLSSKLSVETSGSRGYGFNDTSGGSGTKACVFGSLGVEVGSISTTTTATSYNTSSDYRLKDNQQPLTNSGAFIDALKPKTWNWRADGRKGVGFIAHEVQAVSPSSVVGEKDAVDADGRPVMQAMEYGSAEFIANIVAELQSLRARVAALEA